MQLQPTGIDRLSYVIIMTLYIPTSQASTYRHLSPHGLDKSTK